jgi:hypothetical protein
LWPAKQQPRIPARATPKTIGATSAPCGATLQPGAFAPPRGIAAVRKFDDDGIFRTAAKGISAGLRRKNRLVLSIVSESMEFANIRNSSMKSKAQDFHGIFDGICVERR